METKFESFTEYCKEFVKDHIDGYIGGMYYGSDLGTTITEGINADGSCTYNAWKAKEYLREWWDDCGAYWEWEKSNLGEHLWNPFESPEAFMTCMVIEGVNNLINGYLNEHEELWNGSFELTQDIADEICEFVDAASDIEF